MVIIKSNLPGVHFLFTVEGIKIPNYITNKIDSVNMNLQNNNLELENGNGSIPLASWNKICAPKCEEGLRIRKTKDANAGLRKHLDGKF